MVDEKTTDQVALVGITVEFEGVGEEVVDVHHTDIGVVVLLGDVGVLPNGVRRLKVEDIGLHLEDQDVVGHLQLCLKLTTIAILQADAAVELPVEGIIELGGHLQQGLFELVERREGAVKNVLFEGRFANDGLQNLLA